MERLWTMHFKFGIWNNLNRTFSLKSDVILQGCYYVLSIKYKYNLKNRLCKNIEILFFIVWRRILLLFLYFKLPYESCSATESHG